MNKYHVISWVFFLVGLVLLSLGFIQGELQTGIVLIFPFIAGTGIYGFFGVISFFLAFIFFMLALNPRTNIDQTMGEEHRYYDGGYPKNKRFKGGGVVFIGPIPIVFGSSWKVALLLMILAVIFIVIYVFFLNMSLS